MRLWLVLVASCKLGEPAVPELVLAQTSDGGPALVETDGGDIAPAKPRDVVLADEIACEATAEGLHLTEGQPRVVLCPDNCRGAIWGTDVYTTDSMICVAGVHAGIAGGAVRVTWAAGEKSYAGTTRNGVTSAAWGDYMSSFKVERALGQVAVRPMPTDCKTTAKSITTRAEVTCPAGCSGEHVWGTDVYTDDSSLCAAAIHAGVIGQGGGRVIVVIEPGATSYSGTTRNGVTTDSYGQWDRSFSVR